MYQPARPHLSMAMNPAPEGGPVKRCIAALFVAFVAFPTVASAIPPEDGTRRPPPPLVQPAGPEVPSHLPARGTDVAAPDQQASKPAPAPVSELSDSGFDWTDAGIGAIAGTALAAFAIAGAVGLRRRRAAPLAG
jgi:hypothetical protein